MFNITKVETLIKEKGWSKAYFCKRFDHSRTWIDDWKRGRGIPDGNTLDAIAEALETTTDYLTDKTEQKNRPSTGAEGYSQETINLLKRIERLSPANRAKLSELIDLYLSAQDKN